MNFKTDVFAYLNGKSFSNGLNVSFNNMPLITRDKLGRQDYLVALCKSKKIIHAGCTDHIPLIKMKISQNRWLHKALSDVAETCVGIDISKEAIEYCKNEVGYKNVFYMDVISDKLIEPLLQDYFDFLILGEILEHVDNPVFFLTSIKEKFSGICKQIIVTVPNAFKYTNFLNAFKKIENINTDHRFWFTPYTLAKVLTVSGFKIDEFAMVQHGGGYPRFNLFRKILLSIPMLRDDIVMIASL